MVMYSQDIDPALAIEILPEKIRLSKRRITDCALDLSILSTMPDHAAQEVTYLETQLRLQKAILAEYENRLAAIQKAAQGPDREADTATPATEPTAEKAGPTPGP